MFPPLPADDLDHVLTHTRKFWAGARGARFFITGGTGFFGIWLLETFARANDALGLGMGAVVLTRDPAAFGKKAPHLVARPDLKFIPGDLRDFDYPGGPFDHVIHAAAETNVWTRKESAAGLLERIEEGTRHLLAFVGAAGVRKFLLVSSGSVYGPQPLVLPHVPDDHAGLTDPLPVDAAWAEGKRMAERLCLAHAAKQAYSLTIARCFAFVGPHLDEHYAIGSFLRDARQGGPIVVAGDGTPHRSYLYASDLAIWLWTILFKGASGRAYNVGSPETMPIAEVARAVAAAAGRPLPVEIRGAPIPGAPPSRYVPAIDRAANELRLRVRVPLDEAIRRTMAWQRTAYAAKSL